MAGGTISSDFASAKDMGIPQHDVNKAIILAKEVIGLGTPVTPFSEWIKQIGFAIWKNEEIQPKNAEAVTAYIEAGGKLLIAQPILEGLQAWETLLVRPTIVAKLLQNHGISPHPSEAKEVPVETFNVEEERAKLQAELPGQKVTDRKLCTALAFVNIGLAFLKSTINLTPLMSSPGFVHSQFKKVGDSFEIEGEKITITKIQPKENGTVDVEYNFQGHIIRTNALNPNRLAQVAIREVRKLKDKEREVAAHLAGKLEKILVKPGDEVKPQQPVATLNVMKMEHVVKAPHAGTVEYVRPSTNGDMVEQNEVLIAFRR